MNTYAQLGLGDLSAGVEALPPVPRTTGPSGDNETSLRGAQYGALGAQNSALRLSPDGLSLARCDTESVATDIQTCAGGRDSKSVLASDFGNGCRSVTSVVTALEAEEEGFEPSVPRRGTPVSMSCP